MVSLNTQGKTGCGVLPEMWAAKCPGTLIRLFENVFHPRTTILDKVSAYKRVPNVS